MQDGTPPDDQSPLLVGGYSSGSDFCLTHGTVNVRPQLSRQMRSATTMAKHGRSLDRRTIRKFARE
jgi:hypothetical protein